MVSPTFHNHHTGQTPVQNITHPKERTSQILFQMCFVGELALYPFVDVKNLVLKMEDEFAAFDFPELIQMPSIDFGDPISLNSMEKSTLDSVSSGSRDENIDKIHEYLDRDLADQDTLIKRMEDFEARLDRYLQRYDK